MLASDGSFLVGAAQGRELGLLPGMACRHGLITGATGSGKTITLQTLAGAFSAAGVPVFMADVKGDLSGLAAPGEATGKIAARLESMGLAGRFAPRAFPVRFWDVFGRQGTPLRTTISEMGPLVLGRILDLNDVQAGVLQIVFRVADDQGLLLLDLKDLRSMVQHVGDERNELKASYGQISPQSIGAIQRALLRLEEEGGDIFFGEPALDVMDLLAVDGQGAGYVNILAAESLMAMPALYSCVLLWLISELYERLPELGEVEKPRLVFFFDEAHLLFDTIPSPLLKKIEQMVRLIRSKGVGIYFVSQSPGDMPDCILGQLGNRVQHALRAFTPKDKKAVRAAAESFRANPAFSTEEAIGQLGVGEALVSFLDASGAPRMVEKALIVPPESHIGPIAEAERARLVAASPMQRKYGSPIDRESAWEILAARARAAEAQAAAVPPPQPRRAPGTQAGHRPAAASRARQPELGDVVGSVIRQTTRAVGSTVGREIGRTLIRGLLGSLLGKK